MNDEEEQDQSSSLSSSESEEEDEQAGTNSTDIVDIDFEARSPEEGDAASIQRLLFQLFQEGSGIDFKGLTDLIISQNYVGAVVFQPNDEGPEEPEESTSDSEEDIFGVTTVINLAARKDKAPVQEFLAFLKKKYDTRQNVMEDNIKFSSFFDEKLTNVGWILNERFVNLPAQIAPSLFDSLKKDVAEASAKSMPYKFDYYVIIAKAHIPKGGSIGNPLFVNEEEEFLFGDALATFTYFVGKGKDAVTATSEWKNKKDKELTAVRIAMLLEPAKFDKGLAEFKKLLPT